MRMPQKALNQIERMRLLSDRSGAPFRHRGSHVPSPVGSRAVRGKNARVTIILGAPEFLVAIEVSGLRNAKARRGLFTSPRLRGEVGFLAQPDIRVRGRLNTGGVGDKKNLGTRESNAAPMNPPPPTVSQLAPPPRRGPLTRNPRV